MYSVPRTFCLRRQRQDIAPLLAIPAFGDVDPRRLAELAPHTDSLRLPRGRTLARAGRTARELIIIVAGEATVLHRDGRTAVLHAGAQIGGGEVVHNERHAATVVAASEVEVVVVNGPAVVWANRQGLVGPFAPPAGVATASPARRPDVDPQARLAS